MKTEQLVITIPVTISYEKGCRKEATSQLKSLFKNDVVPFGIEDYSFSTGKINYRVTGKKFKVSKDTERST